MSSKAEKERQKQIQDKCQALLNQMLRDEDNKYCVDCDAKGPRWASWNLGIFLCIRCAGIHRNLGVHISKVKSVNLDSWTPEQVVSLQQMGNSRARAVYEANLPDQFRRPQFDSALEAFVRAKYEAKKYIAREWVPPALPKVNWDKELDEEAERARRKKREGKTPPISSSLAGGVGRKALDSVIAQPLPKPTTSPKPQRSPSSNTPTMIQRNTPVSADLLGLDSSGAGEKSPSSVGSGSDDLFSSFLSAPGNSPRHSAPATVPTTTALTTTSDTPLMSNKRTPEEESFFNQLSSTGKKQLTTDSILALYAKAPLQPPLFGGGSGYHGQGVGVLQQGLGIVPQGVGGVPLPQGVGGVPLTQGVSSGLHATTAMPQGVGISPQAVGIFPQAVGVFPQGINLPQGVGLPQTVGVQPAIGGFQPSGFTIPNGVMSQNNMQSGLFGALVGATPANVNIASNPFYNMASTLPPAAYQQQSFPPANKLSQQMSGVNLTGAAPSNPYMAPVQFPASTQLGQTLATNLWQ